MKTKNGIIVYGIKCKCGRFVDFADEVRKIRREQKEKFKKILEGLKKEKRFAPTYHAQCCKLEREEVITKALKEL